METLASNVSHSTDLSTRQAARSAQDQPLSTIRAAIHLPGDDGATLIRANTCLALYFDPDGDEETRLGVRVAFVTALRGIPEWAMHKAFDVWQRSGVRRPSPAEVVILAERQIAALNGEIKRRTPPPPDLPRATPDAATAEEIMNRAGFTPARMNAVRAAPMAGTFAQAETQARSTARPHWSETADPDGPEWAALRASRAKNRLINPGAPA